MDRVLERFGDISPQRVRAYRVRFAGIEGTVDLAAILNGFVGFVRALNSSDLASLDVILVWFLVD